MGGILREEHLDVMLEFGNEGEVVGWFLVAVGFCLGDDVLFAAAEDGAAVVGAGFADCGEEILLHGVGGCYGCVGTAAAAGVIG